MTGITHRPHPEQSAIAHSPHPEEPQSSAAAP